MAMMRQRTFWLTLAALILVLALLLPPGKVPLALALIAGLSLIAGVLALALVGALLLIVCVVTYRQRQREAIASPWSAEVAATDTPVPEIVRELRATNGKH